MKFDYRKYLRFKKSDFSMLSHAELTACAYEFMEAYKSANYRKEVGRNKMESNIIKIGEKIDELEEVIKNNSEFEKKYNILRHRKLTFKERLFGRIRKED